MGRTESKTFQCHPNDAQEQINLYQQFHWSLLSSQDVKTVDNSLEKRGDTVYSVRQSEHYVKLTFSRDLDTPNLSEIKKLESDYFRHLGLPEPVRRRNPEEPVPDGVLGIPAITLLSLIIGGVLWYSMSFVIGLVAFIIGCVLSYIYSIVITQSEKTSAERAAWRKECDRADQEHKQNVQNFYDERQRILSEVAKYN